MAYNKTNWENSPSTNTPINAANLNKIEQGIYDLDQTTYKISNFVLLTGTIIMPEAGDTNLTGSVTINYPDGFNENNTVIISLMAKRSASENGFATTLSARTAAYVNGNSDLYARLDSDGIKIFENKVSASQSSTEMNIKILLLKYI